MLCLSFLHRFVLPSSFSRNDRGYFTHKRVPDSGIQGPSKLQDSATRIAANNSVTRVWLKRAGELFLEASTPSPDKGSASFLSSRPDERATGLLFPVTNAHETFNKSTEGWLLVPSSTAPAPQAPPPRQPRPGRAPPRAPAPVPLSGGAACVPRGAGCKRSLAPAGLLLPSPAPSLPLVGHCLRAPRPPGPSRRGRRDPRPRPLPTQSFGGGGKCPGSGPAGGGSGRAGFPPSSSSPPYRLPPPPPPLLLLPRSPWGCSPAARKVDQQGLMTHPSISTLMWQLHILSQESEGTLP
ncbi:inverted formin-2-like [Symphalangus syndactylus]|uniref:inverted formin-2-like n=1 Tax=Symphalangus syndactylus TaxID=9590 RepID=UPI0030079E12